MGARVETLALAAMVLAGCVLLVGELASQNWVGAAMWAVAVAAVTTVALRRLRQDPRS